MVVRRSRWQLVLVGVAFGASISGCAELDPLSNDDGADTTTSRQDQGQQRPGRHRERGIGRRTYGNQDPGSAARWTCSYSPTMNDDWHDDVLCSNGIDQDRPYLLPNDSFITEAEIMRAAAEYEATLNGG